MERTVVERKLLLDGSVTEFVCERLVVEPPEHAVLRYVVDRPWPIADSGLVVPPGALTVGHYWQDRPYNVYHWLLAGTTLALYANVADRTVIRPDVVEFRDLAVDVLIRPSTPIAVLDEDEVPADLSARDRETIERALALLLGDPDALVEEIEPASAAALSSRGQQRRRPARS